MKLRDIIIAGAIVIFLFVAYTAINYVGEIGEESKPPEKFSFGLKEFGRAGEYGYVVFLLNGTANITLVGYGVYAPLKINVINDAEGVDTERIPELVEKIKVLEDYGYEIKLSDRRMITDEINIVATGAMPNYVLDAIKANVTNGVVVYIGRTDWVLRSGSILNENWYENLTEEQKNRILVYNGTVVGFLDRKMENRMIEDILKNSWSFETAASYNITANETTTRILKINKSRYLRVIYKSDAAQGIVDSQALPPPPEIILRLQPEGIYPWQSSTLVYRIEKSNGTVYFSIYKNGLEESAERLRRVVEGSYFSETLTQKESGYYILVLSDNSGTIGSGILHVKKLDVVYDSRVYNTYYFNVTEDGEPLSKNIAAIASLANGTKRTYYTSNGRLAISALLKKGENIFNIEIEGKTFRIPVIRKQDTVWDVYINYGLPGFLVVLVVYVIARLSKRQMYVLKISEGWSDIRNEIKVKEEDIIEAVKKIKKDAKLGQYPITGAEFDMAIKRYVTHGAEITEGNSEEILRKMIKKGKLERYGDYYNFANEDNIREKTLLRQIRETIIENGIVLKEMKNGFSTKNYDVVIPGYGRKNRKTIVVFEDAKTLARYEDGMDERERALTRIKRTNGILVFTTIKELSHHL